jgi:hypothetical protein
MICLRSISGKLRSVAVICGKLRSVAVSPYVHRLSCEFIKVGWLPIRQHSPHEASSASADVHEGVVLPFQATMAGFHGDVVGLPSQLSASVILQDSLLLSIECQNSSSLALALGVLAFG